MMNSILSKVVLFAAGATVGSAVTWKLVKDKYERMAQEDIEAVREFYSSKKQDSLEDDPEDVVVEECDEPTPREVYSEVVNDLGYGDLSSEKIIEEEDDDVSEPYVISPSEYGEMGYETESLWYYEGDGIVTTYFGELIEDVDELVGPDFADHYGEYEEDSVHVRNDKLKIDYEILRDLSSFSEK